jgi:hypothetical protein
VKAPAGGASFLLVHAACEAPEQDARDGSSQAVRILQLTLFFIRFARFPQRGKLQAGSNPGKKCRYRFAFCHLAAEVSWLAQEIRHSILTSRLIVNPVLTIWAAGSA